jgi:hypothetical protein
LNRWVKVLLFAGLFLLVGKSSSAQGGYASQVVWRYTPAGAFPAGGGTVTICTSNATGTPCTPTVSLFSDVALTMSVTNPLAQCTVSPQIGCIDNLGNFSFYATPALYTYTVTGAGLTPYGPIPIAAVNPAGGGGGGTFTGSISAGQVAFGIAPGNVINGSANFTYVSSSNLFGVQSSACPLTFIVTATFCGQTNSSLGAQGGPVEIIQTAASPPDGCGLTMSNSNSTGNSGTSRATYTCFRQKTSGVFELTQVLPAGNAVGSWDFDATGGADFGTTLANGTDFVEISTDATGGASLTSTVPNKGFCIFGSTSGEECIGTPPVGGAACQFDLPTVSPTAGQILSAAAPVANICQTSWITNVANSAVFPVTVSGTVNSGGLPCFTSSTVEATSPVIGAGILIKGGGAAACVNVSSITDNGTTVTTTDTGGVVTPVLTTNGTTAGFVDYPQGTSSLAVAPCNTANSICDQAPTAVTAYTLTEPGAAPVIASYKQTDVCASSNCTLTYHPVPLTLTVTADFITAANTNLQAITGLTFTNPANTALISKWDCDIQYNQQTAAVADAFGIQDVTIAPNEIDASGFVQTAATTWVDSVLNALASTTATNIVAMTPSAITTIWHAQIRATVDHPSNASSSVIQLMVKTGTSGDTVTVKRGSACLVTFQ